MTQQTDRVTRRGVLRTGGIAGAALAGLPAVVGARGNGNGGGGGNPRDVTIEDSIRADSSAGRGIRTARPSLDFFPRTTILPAHRFRIDNVDTGDSVTVTVDSNKRPDTDAANFFISKPDGSLRGDKTEITCYTFTATGVESVTLDTTIEGDESIFHGGNPGSSSYHDYQLTMLMGNSEVATTSEHLIPIAHPTEYRSSAEDGVIEFSYNADHLPSDTSETVARLFTGTGNIPAQVDYDGTEGRLVATIEPSNPTQVPHGTYRVSLTVANPTTGWRVISFKNQVTIGEDF